MMRLTYGGKFVGSGPAHGYFENWNSARQSIALLCRELCERRCERRDSASPAVMQQPCSARRRFYANDASVRGIDFAVDESIGLERRDEFGDRRRAHLFGRGERAECDRSTEDDDGERGERRRGESGRIVLSSEAAEEVDGD